MNECFTYLTSSCLLPQDAFLLTRIPKNLKMANCCATPLPRGTINLANIKLLVHFEWNVYSVLQNYVQFNCARWFLLQFRLNKKHVCWNNLLSKFRLKSKYGCRAAEPGRAPHLHNIPPSGWCLGCWEQTILESRGRGHTAIILCVLSRVTCIHLFPMQPVVYPGTF